MLGKGYFKQSIIGQYEFDVAWVYFHLKLSFLHRWIVLSNPESASFNEVEGYLKLSISVATEVMSRSRSRRTVGRIAQKIL